MRGYLVAIFLSAVFLYYVLHCILWGTNVYGVPPIEMKHRNKIQPCLSKPAFASLLRVPCKRCVVVGNGGVLKNKSLGEKIDSYDVIIRMNNGPVLEHEEEVGRRTTFRLFYPESVFSDQSHNDPNSTVILAAFKPLDLKWLFELLSDGKINTSGFWKKPALNLIYQPYQIRILDPFIIRTAAFELLHFPKTFPKNQKPKHPTTGIIAITLAFHICHEVHLAGFKYNFSDLNSPLHYYGNATMSLMTKPFSSPGDNMEPRQRCSGLITLHSSEATFRWMISHSALPFWEREEERSTLEDNRGSEFMRLIMQASPTEIKYFINT
ncbi:type 2 lactosamine alpha-2,3-sialyltransferase isoform X3 [Marmota marmota marmota]|uniref:type 2 lactosamine alpha-2,3-sialyltransferase isoform X3 n=1 Tax=Marmota marmota marmota TaxID=9994 RepID=UPI002093872E|nr:type 2 lactosamine alpha-2,3-sialyltransferase isoform X3 [Marmota marmota marmota]XP_048659438.1 type 2 lactosamine alpha-2,3-sialyltransferase isoform X3 [Marmota marmota marmota]